MWQHKQGRAPLVCSTNSLSCGQTGASFPTVGYATLFRSFWPGDVFCTVSGDRDE
ncbi:hypothetical protein HMPREF9141_1031 [Prevotella multiformis DSM 16608]|uniref:Uncharacterized protein n=1 Tax=Prevotella multiformis DSM 16608 TaxID=888743 RepID=F0F614_9BACT|nr:hypothetical protein HMPREF9141_1031 [Prevotella multiformis DSM 16608]